ncbi:Dyp-type peroxidase [Roseivirga sp. BDSF3-8]|uniref:Dyp-type peroxidase n=1 Tax=Roseivirga sp. BDSF3-8 TaxID=3241598 RepID=UPI003531B173
MISGENKHITETKEIYENLQGNILKFHGRQYGYHIFLKFREWRQREVKKWIREDIVPTITSTEDQIQDGKKRKKDKKHDGGLFTTFGLSAQGYSYLHLRSIPSDIAYMKGMKGRRHLLGDRDEDQSLAYADTLHAVLVLADDSLKKLKKEKQKLEEKLAVLGIGEVVIAELGSVQKKDGQVEMTNGFGFRDGISSPYFTKKDEKAYLKEQQKATGLEDPLEIFNPDTSLDEILVNDELTRAPHTFGSYYVFRKYDLNTLGFNKDIQEIGKQINLKANKKENDPYGIDLAGAYIFGRFKDGTPVVKRDTPEGNKGAKDNTFDFSDDAYGSKCPFHAHIRKMNPRKNLPDNEPYYPKATITRRGMNQETGGTITGLLFGCFQSSIINQFEKLQAGWANISWEPAGRAGVDPIIGNKPEVSDYEFTPELYAESEVGLLPYRQRYSFPYKHGVHSNLPFDLDEENYFTHSFDAHTKMVGGEYFFFPSIPGLKELKDVNAPENTNTPMLQRLQYVVTKLWTSDEDLQNFREDYRGCLQEWLGLHMHASVRLVLSETKVNTNDVYTIEDGYVMVYLDISGKPNHLSNEQIRQLSLDEFRKYNELSLVTASVLFDPYFLMGW